MTYSLHIDIGADGSATASVPYGQPPAGSYAISGHLDDTSESLGVTRYGVPGDSQQMSVSGYRTLPQAVPAEADPTTPPPASAGLLPTEHAPTAGPGTAGTEAASGPTAPASPSDPDSAPAPDVPAQRVHEAQYPAGF